VSLGPQLVAPQQREERNWLPLMIAAALVLSVAAGVILTLERGKGKTTVTPISAPLDSYAGSLSLTQVTMSESSNLAGGKVTYVDGHIANQGARTITAVTVQVLFRNYAHEVTQNETLPLKLVRVRLPYIDLETVSAAPMAPGADQDFRLIFDSVSPDWDGAYPEIRVVHVETR